MSAFKSLSNFAVHHILYASAKILELLDRKFLNHSKKDGLLHRGRGKQTMAVTPSYMDTADEESDLIDLQDDCNEFTELEELSDEQGAGIDDGEAESSEEMIMIDYTEDETAGVADEMHDNRTCESIDLSTTSYVNDEGQNNLLEFGTFKEIEDRTPPQESDSEEAEKEIARLSYYSENEENIDDELQDAPVNLSTQVGDIDQKSGDSLPVNLSSISIQTEELKEASEYVSLPLEDACQHLQEDRVDTSEEKGLASEVESACHNVGEDKGKASDCQQDVVSPPRYRKADILVCHGDNDREIQSMPAVNPTIFEPMDRYITLVPGIQIDYQLPVYPSPAKFLSVGNPDRQNVDSLYEHSGLRIFNIFVDYDTTDDSDMPLVVIGKSAHSMPKEREDIAKDNQFIRGVAKEMPTLMAEVGKSEDSSGDETENTYAVLPDEIVDRVPSDMEFSTDEATICPSEPIAHEKKVESSILSDSEPDPLVDETSAIPACRPKSVIGAKTNTFKSTSSLYRADVSTCGKEITAAWYSTSRDIYQESSVMTSILKGLRVARIPSDDEDLTLQVKWELSMKRRAGLFISQGETGNVAGAITITRSELKHFSPQAREAYLVFWLEGIRTMRMVVDKMPPSLDDIQAAMIHEASYIVEKKLVRLKQFKDLIARVSDDEIERNLYHYIRELYFIQRDNLHDESLEGSWGTFLSTLRKKEIADRSHWISQYGDEYVKFLDAHGKLEIDVLAYVNQRMKQELPGFHLAEDGCVYVLNIEDLHKFKEEVMSVDGLLSYLNFELAKIKLPNTTESFIGLIGDGYLGRYIVYKPVGGIEGKLPQQQTGTSLSQGSSDNPVLSMHR